MENNLAPIVLFVYNRLDHTKKVIECLKENIHSKDSNLYIYSDGSKNDKDEIMVKNIRQYLSTLQGFKSIKLIKREENLGLAKSIKTGVTEVINEHGKVIVLEDDIITSPFFLTFMNNSLNKFEKEKRIWHISGWNYPVKFETKEDTFFWRVMNCWGWGTWSDRWNCYLDNSENFTSEWSYFKKRSFDLDGSGVFWNQIKLNEKGKLNTWAIYWYATIFQNSGLCLNPVKSYVDNIGHDGSGINCGINKEYNQYILNNNKTTSYPVEIRESSEAVNIIKRFYRNQRNSRVKIFIIKTFQILKYILRKIKEYIYFFKK